MQVRSRVLCAPVRVLAFPCSAEQYGIDGSPLMEWPLFTLGSRLRENRESSPICRSPKSARTKAHAQTGLCWSNARYKAAKKSSYRVDESGSEAPHGFSAHSSVVQTQAFLILTVLLGCA